VVIEYCLSTVIFFEVIKDNVIFWVSLYYIG